MAKGAASELSQVDAALHAIQKENRVTYAAPFCGRPAGHHLENGIAVLATSSPQIISPGFGDLTPLEDFFRDLLGRGQDPLADTQFEVFVGWLQRWRRALQNPSQHLPGQALFLIGPKDCGKTFAQTLLTHLSGGRSADPSLWLFGRSDFNGELWGAEHLEMSDANVEDSYSARRALRDSVKRVAANPNHNCHRKHRDVVTLRAIWRLTVSANPDVDSSTIIPPLDDSSRDKVLYLKCYLPAKPFPTSTEAGAEAFLRSLKEAAPAFLTAVEGFELPEALRGSRFGVKEFQHPDIAEELAGVHPDADAADLIDAWLAGHSEEETSGTAAELFGRIEAGHHPSVVWTRAVRSATALGQLLRRLSHVPVWSERIGEETIRVGENRVQRTVWTLRKNAQKSALKKAA